MAEDTLG